MYGLLGSPTVPPPAQPVIPRGQRCSACDVGWLGIPGSECWSCGDPEATPLLLQLPTRPRSTPPIRCWADSGTFRTVTNSDNGHVTQVPLECDAFADESRAGLCPRHYLEIVGTESK